MTKYGKACENCKYTGVPVTRYPCKSCGPDMKNYIGAEQKIKAIYVDPPYGIQGQQYGLCRKGHLTAEGLCGIISYNTPCQQTDCPEWDYPQQSDELWTRLLKLCAEHGRLEALHKDREIWPEVSAALMDRIDRLKEQVQEAAL